MKSYVTSGTGSQQTLTGSQDEKVAVYQTLADAEADLANLEEGQIVATPDTGDENAQPVDVIQAGNMHAVTSNAVATSNAMPVDEVTVNNVHSVTSNAVARNIVNAVTSGETKPVTSGAVYSAIRDFFNQSNETRVRSANLNNVTYPLVSFDTDTQNKPTNWGVCYTFGRAIYSTEAGESRWYYQLVFGTNGNIYFRYAENPTSSSTTPDNWTSWKRIAFV